MYIYTCIYVYINTYTKPIGLCDTTTHRELLWEPPQI